MWIEAEALQRSKGSVVSAYIPLLTDPFPLGSRCSSNTGLAAPEYAKCMLASGPLHLRPSLECSSPDVYVTRFLTLFTPLLKRPVLREIISQQPICSPVSTHICLPPYCPSQRSPAPLQGSPCSLCWSYNSLWPWLVLSNCFQNK